MSLMVLVELSLQLISSKGNGAQGHQTCLKRKAFC